MTYEYFVKHIDDYVEHIVEFEFMLTVSGKIFKTQRYVWDNKEFGMPDDNNLVKPLSAKDLGYKKPVSAAGIKAI